jgi:hypothetical protein
MLRLPWFSSMHLRKLVTFSAHGPACACWPVVLTWCACWNSVDVGDASAGALEPPENQPPTAWPIEEPTATPLQIPC